MIDNEFKTASDAILDQRMATYRYLTSIVGQNTRKAELQWYLDKRNRQKNKLVQYQDLQELELRFLPHMPNHYQSGCTALQAYSQYVDDRGYEFPQANPDLLAETDVASSHIASNSPERAALIQLLNTAKDILSTQEYKVFALLKRGKGSGEIAPLLGLKQSTVSTIIKRIKTKFHGQNI